MKTILLAALLTMAPVKNHVYNITTPGECIALINKGTKEVKKQDEYKKYYIRSLYGLYALKVTKRAQGFYIYEFFHTVNQAKNAKGQENVFLQINKYRAANQMWLKIKKDYGK